MRLIGIAVLTSVCFVMAACGQPQVETTAVESSDNTVYLHLKTGTVVIKLRPDLAPKHVARVKKLTREGFYDGLKFHRVIAGFMAQTGDPSGTGLGGSKYGDLAAEFTHTPFTRGTIGAARTNNPHSANSQFFICFAPAPFLNGKYTVWGEVVSGMEYVDQIAKGEPPAKPDVIVKMTFDAKA
ncbi:MAG: peptidylprolyl isomerase [Alphaproteobacteria bacterium]|nr:peptidylprolyl isomerase [Alphaproteobacteria bacterium]